MTSNLQQPPSTSDGLRRRRGDSTANPASSSTTASPLSPGDQSYFAEPLITKQNTEAYVANAMNNNNTNNNRSRGDSRSSSTTTPQNGSNNNLEDSNDTGFILPTSHSASANLNNVAASTNNNNNNNPKPPQILPDLSDCILTPERVNAHAVMNKWITVDETRNFALLKKEKRAVVTFQCRIVVKGARHIQFQVACGPSVEFLMPSWLLIRYIQSELLPPCIFEDYRLVETWMKNFIPEMKSLAEKATNMIIQASENNSDCYSSNGGPTAQQIQEQQLLHSPQMTRHLVHAAASIVNSSGLFLALISASKENAASGGVAGDAGIGLMHVSGGQVYHGPGSANLGVSSISRSRGGGSGGGGGSRNKNGSGGTGGGGGGVDDDDDESSSSDGDGEFIHALIQDELGNNNNKGVAAGAASSATSKSTVTPPSSPSSVFGGATNNNSSNTSTQPAPPQQQKTGMFSNLRNYLANRSSNNNNNNNNSAASNSNTNNNGSSNAELDPAALLADPSLLSPEQRLLLQQVSLVTLIPAPIRSGPPNPRTDGVLATLSWIVSAVKATAASLKREEIRARFILPRPTTREQFNARDVLREQVKKNRTVVAMVVAVIYLLICRYVSFDLFLIIAAISVYGVRHLFTEYKSIFLNLTKRTARSRVNRVKDWFAFTVRRKQTNAISNASNLKDNNNNNDDDGGAGDAGPPDFDLEEWDFF